MVFCPLLSLLVILVVPLLFHQPVILVMPSARPSASLTRFLADCLGHPPDIFFLSNLFGRSPADFCSCPAPLRN